MIMRITKEQVENNVKLLKGQPVEKITMWLGALRLDRESLKMMAERIGSKESTIPGVARDMSRYCGL